MDFETVIESLQDKNLIRLVLEEMLNGDIDYNTISIIVKYANDYDVRYNIGELLQALDSAQLGRLVEENLNNEDFIIDLSEHYDADALDDLDYDIVRELAVRYHDNNEIVEAIHPFKVIYELKDEPTALELFDRYSDRLNNNQIQSLATYGGIDLVKKIYDKYRINVDDALHGAAQIGNPQVVEFYLDRGATNIDRVRRTVEYLLGKDKISNQTDDYLEILDMLGEGEEEEINYSDYFSDDE